MLFYYCDGGDGLVLVGGRREYLNEETYNDERHENKEAQGPKDSLSPSDEDS